MDMAQCIQCLIKFLSKYHRIQGSFLYRNRRIIFQSEIGKSHEA
jgi:hypothetical protein